MKNSIASLLFVKIVKKLKDVVVVIYGTIQRIVNLKKMMNFNVPELLDASFVIRNTVSTVILSGIPVRGVFLYFVPNVLGFDVKNAMPCSAKPVGANMDLNVIIIKQLFVVTREQQNKYN